jgi:hypothetical protein
MATPDGGGTFGSALSALQERVRLRTTRRAEVAWRALLEQVNARSATVVETLLAACGESTLQRFVASAQPLLSTQEADTEACVGNLGIQRVLLLLRRHLADRPTPATAEGGSPGASERFGISELRRHRSEVRRIFQDVKAELWMSVVRAALLEAGALVVRVEARCSETEIWSFRRHLREDLRERPSPLGTPGAELQTVAEYVALEQVLATLEQRPHGDPSTGDRQRRAG